MKILIITNIPSPHRLALFDVLHKRFMRLGHQMRVVFADESHKRRRWHIDMSNYVFDYGMLYSRNCSFGRGDEHVSFAYTGLWREIKRYDPDIVITPGFSLATVKVSMMSLLYAFEHLIWTGSIQGRLNSWPRLVQRRLLARNVDGALVYGRRAHQYLRFLGVEDQRIFTAINTVDTAFFRSETQRLRRETSKQATDKKVLTYVGELSPRKNVEKILQVISRLREYRSDFVLEIIGTGTEQEKLLRFVGQHELDRFVVFRQFQANNKLPSFLAHSYCFLFQTDFDIWGLVLNEAMAAGVPCLASIHAGSSHDLIEEGRTGFIVDFDNVDYVAEKIHWLLRHPDVAKSIGEQASRFVDREASLEKCADGFVHSVNACKARRHEQQTA